ncbi:MAG: transposon-transfer assisting family protein [Lachnospiraceae bacterium]
MPEFEPDERNLILLYNTGSREGLMKELNEMLPHMEQDQDALRGMAVSVVEKLGRMTDADFCAYCAELEPDF